MRTTEASNSPVSRSSRDIGDMFDIDQRLSSWQEHLDFRLRVPTTYADHSRTGYIERQANILHARYSQLLWMNEHEILADTWSRYLYARLLLFRPYLTHVQLHKTSSNSATPSTETAAFDFMVSKCQLLCVQAAQSLIDHIFRDLTC